MKEKIKNYNFHYVTKHIGKGERGSLKTLHAKNENNVIIKIIINRNKIEREIVKYNREHFTQAHNIKIYHNKIYYQLKENNTRDKKLTG